MGHGPAAGQQRRAGQCRGTGRTGQGFATGQDLYRHQRPDRATAIGQADAAGPVRLYRRSRAGKDRSSPGGQGPGAAHAPGRRAQGIHRRRQQDGRMGGAPAWYPPGDFHRQWTCQSQGIEQDPAQAVLQRNRTGRVPRAPADRGGAQGHSRNRQADPGIAPVSGGRLVPGQRRQAVRHRYPGHRLAREGQWPGHVPLAQGVPPVPVVVGWHRDVRSQQQDGELRLCQE
ncbi:hypothetical protein D9M71_344930 [compost metagenome]